MNDWTISLPFPPSVNHYWRMVRGKMLISKAGREYRKAVGLLVFPYAAYGVPLFPESFRLSVALLAHPPDRRRRDLDNMLKAALDALQHAGVYADDSQIDHLEIDRGEIWDGGGLEVTIGAL